MAVETSRPLIDARRHELTVTLPPEPLWCEADAARLAQVLANLLNNAAKYTEEGGRIGLTVAREGDEAVFRVRDTGIGIPADMLPRIFELFTQVDRSLDRSEGGLGIGLTLVQQPGRDARRDRSRRSATAPARGASSSSAWPPWLAPRPSKIPKPGSITSRATAGGLRILVVDDNRDSANSLAMLLRGPGAHASRPPTTARRR